MNFQQIKTAFIKLGQSFEKWSESEASVFHEAYIHNNWFTRENVIKVLKSWSGQLTEEKLSKWLSDFEQKEHPPKQVAIIMAGNIPLVGLHDLLCVLLSGNKALVKLSSDDTVLMKYVMQELIRIDPLLEKSIEIVEERLPKAYDAVIATGSNNTNRYFEYYFKDKPSLLRKNRSSVGILTGNETPEDFKKLGEDIFTYFGLGCRNVSKLYVPDSYDFTLMLDNFISFAPIVDHNKYANNYTYHKSIFLMNMTQHLDNGFLLVKQDKRIASPLSVLFYEHYTSEEMLAQLLQDNNEEIQCVVGKTTGYIPFGQAQLPELWDYADGVNTMEFLDGL